MRRAIALLAALGLVAAPAFGAIREGAWKGEASDLEGGVVGPWTFTVAGARMTKLKVTVRTGCGAKVTVRPDKPVAIKAKAFTYSVKAPDGVRITLKGTINARSARGTYTTGPKCKAEGRLRARAST